MIAMKQENILCVTREALENVLDLQAGVIPLPPENIYALITALPYQFVVRSIAEHDSSLKQIIPYCVVSNERGEVFVYERKGSESRLHGFYSLGIGGHINDGDGERSGTVYSLNNKDGNSTTTGTDLGSHGSLITIIFSGAMREIAEELPSLADMLPSLFSTLIERIARSVQTSSETKMRNTRHTREHTLVHTQHTRHAQCQAQEAQEAQEAQGHSSNALHIHGFINEEASPVGSVHLGLVFELNVTVSMINQVDEELLHWRWVPVHQLELETFETWSQLAYQLLYTDRTGRV